MYKPSPEDDPAAPATDVAVTLRVPGALTLCVEAGVAAVCGTIGGMTDATTTLGAVGTVEGVVDELGGSITAGRYQHTPDPMSAFDACRAFASELQS